MKRVLSSLALSVATAFAGVVFAAPAQAAPGNIVLLGDSLLANPPFQAVEYIHPGDLSGTEYRPGRCSHGTERVGVSLRNQTGRVVDDFSCTGAAAYGPIAGGNVLASQINSALAQHAVNPGTHAVVIQIGINDTYKGPGIYSHQEAAFVGALGDVARRVRAVAPHARILMLGYPEVLGPGATACPIHLHGLPDAVIPVGFVQGALDAAQNWQLAAARAHGLGFIDLRAATRGRHMCAPDDVRFVAGIIDNRSKPYNITTHLTHEGNHAVAAVIRRHL